MTPISNIPDTLPFAARAKFLIKALWFASPPSVGEKLRSKLCGRKANESHVDVGCDYVFEIALSWLVPSFTEQRRSHHQCTQVGR